MQAPPIEPPKTALPAVQDTGLPEDMRRMLAEMRERLAMSQGRLSSTHSNSTLQMRLNIIDSDLDYCIELARRLKRRLLV